MRCFVLPAPPAPPSLSLSLSVQCSNRQKALESEQSAWGDPGSAFHTDRDIFTCFKENEPQCPQQGP